MKKKHTCTVLLVAALLIAPRQMMAATESDMYFIETEGSEYSDSQAERDVTVQSEPAAKVDFECMEHDFGEIEFKSGPRLFAFRFRNSGNAPLVITRTEQSCTCLSVKYPRKPVMPGEEGEVEISYSPVKELGIFNNHVKVFSNAAAGSPAVLFVRGEVVK